MEAPTASPRLPRLPLAKEAAEGEPFLVAELKPPRPYDWKSCCETWSVAFSPDGTWFAWSQGHCVVKLIPWPLEGIELHYKASERRSYCVKAEARGRGPAKEKTLDCGQIVWGLAFSPWLPPHPSKPFSRAAAAPCLVLATGLNDGHIKVWEVQTGRLLFNLSGHQGVVRDLSFAPGESRSILVSASRDKTLRVWDLSQNGKGEHGSPQRTAALKLGDARCLLNFATDSGKDLDFTSDVMQGVREYRFLGLQLAPPIRPPTRRLRPLQRLNFLHV